MKIMASDPITSWQIGEKMETVTNIFSNSKITADSNYCHKIKRRLLLGWKAMTNLDSLLKSRDRCHWVDGHKFEHALGVGDGQESLACCSPWGHKESDTTEPLNLTELDTKMLSGRNDSTRLRRKSNIASSLLFEDLYLHLWRKYIIFIPLFNSNKTLIIWIWLQI